MGDDRHLAGDGVLETEEARASASGKDSRPHPTRKGYHMGKRKMRWVAAEMLAERVNESPTEEQVEKAYHLINRLAVLAHDNEVRVERDNDEFYWRGDRFQRMHERFTDRWMERAEEIEGLFGEYKCKVTWPGIYPTVDCIETGRSVIFTDVF